MVQERAVLIMRPTVPRATDIMFLLTIIDVGWQNPPISREAKPNTNIINRIALLGTQYSRRRHRDRTVEATMFAAELANSISSGDARTSAEFLNQDLPRFL